MMNKIPSFTQHENTAQRMNLAFKDLYIRVPTLEYIFEMLFLSTVSVVKVPEYIQERDHAAPKI